MRRKWGFVYFLTNQFRTVLYIGVTNDIHRRITEHKTKVNRGFSSKFNCDRLVYYEVLDSMPDAIAREKQLKNWKREWKNALVDESNSTWEDLSEEVYKLYKEE